MERRHNRKKAKARATAWALCLVVAWLATVFSPARSGAAVAGAAATAAAAAAPTKAKQDLPPPDRPQAVLNTNVADTEGLDPSREATKRRHVSYKSWRRLAGTALMLSRDHPSHGLQRGDVIFVAVEERDVGGFFSEPAVVRHLVSSWGCMLRWWEDKLEEHSEGSGRHERPWLRPPLYGNTFDIKREVLGHVEGPPILSFEVVVSLLFPATLAGVSSEVMERICADAEAEFLDSSTARGPLLCPASSTAAVDTPLPEIVALSGGESGFALPSHPSGRVFLPGQNASLDFWLYLESAEVTDSAMKDRDERLLRARREQARVKRDREQVQRGGEGGGGGGGGGGGEGDEDERESAPGVYGAATSALSRFVSSLPLPEHDICGTYHDSGERRALLLSPPIAAT